MWYWCPLLSVSFRLHPVLYTSFHIQLIMFELFWRNMFYWHVACLLLFEAYICNFFSFCLLCGFWFCWIFFVLFNKNILLKSHGYELATFLNVTAGWMMYEMCDVGFYVFFEKMLKLAYNVEVIPILPSVHMPHLQNYSVDSYEIWFWTSTLKVVRPSYLDLYQSTVALTFMKFKLNFTKFLKNSSLYKIICTWNKIHNPLRSLTFI